MNFRSVSIHLTISTLSIDLAISTLSVDLAISTVDLAISTLSVELAISTVDLAISTVDLAISTVDLAISTVDLAISTREQTDYSLPTSIVAAQSGEQSHTLSILMNILNTMIVQYTVPAIIRAVWVMCVSYVAPVWGICSPGVGYAVAPVWGM